MAARGGTGFRGNSVNTRQLIGVVSGEPADFSQCRRHRALGVRHYAGWWKDHQNRGGQRQAVYVVEADALAALWRNTLLL